MRLYLRPLPFCLLTFLFCACNLLPAAPTPSAQIVPVNITRETPLPAAEPTEDAPIAYTLYINTRNYELSRYEPQYGCYVGAHILADNTINGKIDAFEQLTTAHAIYANEMILGGEYPLTWILECIAQQKTPLLTVHRPNLYEPFDYALLEETAKDIGLFSIPVFVQLLPHAKAEKYHAEAYREFWRTAFVLFREHAPNAALVWTTADTADYESHYPGDAYVDWVSCAYTDHITDDTAEGFGAFYQLFQTRKPIMISPLTISHYTTADRGYTTSEAAAKITALYHMFGEQYPRVKAVIYRNENEAAHEPQNGEILHDYAITTESALFESYADATKSAKYLSAIEMNRAGAIMDILVKSPYPAFKKDGQYYLTEQSILTDLGVRTILPGRRPIAIAGKACYDIAFARECVLIDFYEDAEKRMLVVWQK